MSVVPLTHVISFHFISFKLAACPLYFLDFNAWCQRIAWVGALPLQLGISPCSIRCGFLSIVWFIILYYSLRGDIHLMPIIGTVPVVRGSLSGHSELIRLSVSVMKARILIQTENRSDHLEFGLNPNRQCRDKRSDRVQYNPNSLQGPRFQSFDMSLHQNWHWPSGWDIKLATGCYGRTKCYS